MPLPEGFTKTLDDSLTNPEWDRYDAVLQAEASDYNKRFAGTPGYAPIDWHIFKAMVWIESGGPLKWSGETQIANPTWTTLVMQIGNQGDKGYETLTSGAEATSVIMSDDLKQKLPQALVDPQINVRAGIAYLMNRLAKSAPKSVYDSVDTTTYDYVVNKNDRSLWDIAKQSELGTTIEALTEMNPGVESKIRPGLKIVYRKAAHMRVITGWRPLTAQNAATYYNGGGDPNYEEKLNYALGLIGRIKR